MPHVERLLERVLLLICVVLLGQAAPAGAQDGSPVEHSGPRFLFASASSGKRVEVDVRSVPLFRRRVSLTIENAKLGQALKVIGRQAGVLFSYDPTLAVLERHVTVRADGLTLAATLTEVLFDSGLDVLVSDQRHLALVPRPVAPLSGSITGRVTEAKTGQGIEGVEVLLEGTRWRTLTGADGQYRLVEVDNGTHVATARRIGYTKQSRSVTVVHGQETTVDFALQAAVTKLDELVTTGTVVPTEVKALPTPVTIITETDISLQRPHNIQEVFRRSVPTSVSWDVAGTPYQTALSVRGASTLSTGSGQMKVFVDGIEAATPTNAPIDPNSIERIEVVRGPQAATLYGPDAIGGVVQIFTKRNDPSLSRPKVSAAAAVGRMQTPYAGFGGVLYQNYTASVRGGSGDVSYNLGAGYSHTGDYLPNGEISSYSSPSAYGGMRFSQGIITADISGRFYVNNTPSVAEPALMTTGFVPFSKPNFQPFQIQNHTVGSRIELAPSSWWHHTITAGTDRHNQEVGQARPRLTTPADTLLRVSEFSWTKNSIGYNTSVQKTLGSRLAGSVTAGFDHYRLSLNSYFTQGALNSTGNINLAPGQPVNIGRAITTNTGYFAQAQLSFRDALFFTGGLRADDNSEFGDSLGLPVSPRVGLSYVQQVGGSTLKVRGSWGRAIKAPSAGLKFATLAATSVTLANPELGPERQKGWDAGVDVVFGPHGALSLTYYDQTADDLIQQVRLPDSFPTFQYQNVGRVKNTGVEIEGTLDIGRLQLKGQYGYARARVAELPPNYVGDLRVDDQSLITPKHTAGASASFRPLTGTTVAAGLTYVGTWNLYDFLGLFRCFGGTGPCQPGPGLRNYIIAYPALTKVNASISQLITPLLSGFVSIDNITNNQAHEFSNANPVTGRRTTVGFRFQY